MRPRALFGLLLPIACLIFFKFSREINDRWHVEHSGKAEKQKADNCLPAFVYGFFAIFHFSDGLSGK